MMVSTKGTFSFYFILLGELLFLPILYIRNILDCKKRRNKRVRKPVLTDKVYVEVHEWAGYPISREKQLKNGKTFQCGLKYQLERFHRARQHSQYQIDLTVTMSGLNDYLYDVVYLKDKCNRVLEVSNTGLDFSGYSSFFNHIKDMPNSYVILSNSSVNSSIDLFLDDYIEYMESNPDVGMLGISYCTKMYQTLVRNNFTPHLQSFFLMTTIDVLKEVVSANHGCFPGSNVKNKQLLIRNGEIKISQLTMKLGYNLAVIRPDNGKPFKFLEKALWNIPQGDVRQVIDTPNKINRIKF